MRLVSIGPVGAEQPCVLVDDAHALAVRAVLARRGIEVRDMVDVLSAWPLVRPLLEEAVASEPGFSVGPARWGAPVPRPRKIVGVGMNYDHHTAGLAGAGDAPEPVLFLKPSTAVCGPRDVVVRPPETTALDYELELGVVIGTGGHRIAAGDAWSHVAGLMIANDVSARDVALGAGFENPLSIQLTRAKGFGTFCPTGPWLRTSDEIDPAEPLTLELAVNGEPRQRASTADMRTGVPELIAYVSASMRLEPGDLLLTGSPPGCGFQLDPPQYLQRDDRIAASITGLGRMVLRVTDEEITA